VTARQEQMPDLGGADPIDNIKTRAWLPAVVLMCRQRSSRSPMLATRSDRVTPRSSSRINRKIVARRVKKCGYLGINSRQGEHAVERAATDHLDVQLAARGISGLRRRRPLPRCPRGGYFVASSRRQISSRKQIACGRKSMFYGLVYYSDAHCSAGVA
jgi:hypothetical protein